MHYCVYISYVACVSIVVEIVWTLPFFLAKIEEIVQLYRKRYDLTIMEKTVRYKSSLQISTNFLVKFMFVAFLRK